MKTILASAALFISFSVTNAQIKDTVKLNYNKIYASALDANLKEVLPIVVSAKPVTIRDSQFVADFLKRFNKTSYDSSFVLTKAIELRPLLNLYSSYWRKALLDPAVNYDSTLISDLTVFLQRSYPSDCSRCVSDSLNTYLKKFVESKGYHTTGYGRTGKLLDLLIWEKQTDTFYTDKQNRINVVFLDQFYTLGWEEYATLGRYYPGGWATKEKLFCVRKAYDTDSEQFRINYLAHEGQHFSDYTIFPSLSSTELEYRAKLIELAQGEKELYKTLSTFIRNGSENGANPHTIANYFVIHALSENIFHKKFEPDPEQWRSIAPEKIRRSARNAFQKSTRLLKRQGFLFEKK
jgi:hypothetical protein